MKICPACYAIFVDNKWTFNEDLRGKAMQKREWERCLCPGCDRVAKGRIDGVVHLKGKFLASHKEEAKNLIRRVAEDKLKKNIAARIAHIEEKNDEIVIETTDRALAERLGKEFGKAYHGSLEIQRQKESAFARVYWRRD